MNSRFLGRHVSTRRALVAHGVPAAEAEALIAAARAAGQHEIRIASAGRVLLVRQMRGNHADVFELVGA